LTRDLFGLVAKDNVKPEHTSRRDIGLFRRHRLYGLHINQEDIDFLEYDAPTQLVALIEYKLALDLNHVKPPQAGEPNYANLCALEELANRANIPCFLTFYNPDYKYYRVFPINQLAYKAGPPKEKTSEYQYATFLHWLRGRDIPDEVKVKLYGGGF